MSIRRAIVEADPATINVAEYCRVHCVSTWFFWDLRRRYRLEGDAVLTPKSRASSHPRARTPIEIEDAIVAIRKQLDDAGWDAGPATIAFHLRDLPGLPSLATIWRILTARGMIVPAPAKAPKSGRSFTAERANECWALDDWEWTLTDGTVVHILDIIDDHSRYAVACTALPTCTGAAAFEVMAHAAQFLGWPARFWSDNARVFTGVLAHAAGIIGVAASHTRPNSPSSNGKVERFHDTEHKWLRKQPAATTITELQPQLNLFRLIYNTQRPHRSLDHRFPAEVWTTAPKTGPSDRALGTTTTVHASSVHSGGVNASRYLITVGRRHEHQPALTVITGHHAHVFINGQLVRQLTINPTRRFQTLSQHHDLPSPRGKTRDTQEGRPAT
jgi:transposase InsO family protein